ncbi:MAG: DUF1513 domain-containing protein [Pikeienuella sp.]
MPSRRRFIAVCAVMAAASHVSWAGAGGPAWLSAARRPDGGYGLYGLSPDLRISFEVPLPGRGHAAAAHPFRPIAVAFARRPGVIALVIDCASGQVTAQLTAPEGRHFYGHGVFSADGRRLYTIENDFENGAGIVGVWSVEGGYRRLGEFSSGGVGPHDIRRGPDGLLVIANGGIDTHPDSGRAKLNLPTMQSNIAVLTSEGAVRTTRTMPAKYRLNSIRHLSVNGAGHVAFACQWQVDPVMSPPLIGMFDMAIGTMKVFEQAAHLATPMEGYAGSIAFANDGASIATTSPRGGISAIFGAEGRLLRTKSAPDLCGVAPYGPDGFIMTTGDGRVFSKHSQVSYPLAWDNHLIAV